MKAQTHKAISEKWKGERKPLMCRVKGTFHLQKSEQEKWNAQIL